MSSPIDPDILTFGTFDPDASYRERPSAYVVIRDDQSRIAVVHAGHTYLPGGGLEAGETLEVAAKREALEETGLDVKLLSYLGRADEFTFAANEGQHFVKRCHFFLAQPLDNHGQGEADHVLQWLLPEEAVHALSDGSQRWGVRAAFSMIM